MFDFSFLNIFNPLDSETLYRINSINSPYNTKVDNGRFVNTIEQDVKDLVSSKTSIDKIFLKMSLDDDYKNILYSNNFKFSDKRKELGEMNFVDYIATISPILSSSQMMIFFKTVPENLLFSNDINLQDKVLGEMTPLLRIFYMNPKAFVMFLKYCPEYSNKIKSFSFSNKTHYLDSISINSLFIQKYKNKKMREAIKPYISPENFSSDNAALLALFSKGKNIIDNFINNGYLSEEVAFASLQKAYIVKHIDKKTYQKITDKIMSSGKLASSVFVGNNTVFAGMEPSDFDYFKSKGYLKSLGIEQIMPSLLTCMSLGNKEMASKLLSFNDEIQKETSEIAEKYDSFKHFLFIKNFFILEYLKPNAVNFGKEEPSLANHLDFFMAQTEVNLINLKQKGENILIHLFKDIPDYILTEKDVLILKKYQFDLFDKNNNNEEALDFANKENIKILSKYYLLEIAEKEKEKLLAVLNISDKTTSNGVKRRI